MKKLFGLTFFLSAVGVVALLWLYANIRFDSEKLIDYKPQLTTSLYDTRGELVAYVFDKEHRLYVKYDDIPKRLIEALIAIEDTMFFEHPGVNIEAIFRAIIKDIKAGGLVEGASTLTQQLVRSILLTREKSFIRKIKEVLLALRVELHLTKEEILERYLNQVFFGHGYYGVKTAAQGYFRKSLHELTLKEMAMLVGMQKAPSYYTPTRRLQANLGRANRVINRMYHLGWIDKETFELAHAEVPKVYDDTLTKNKAPYVVSEVVKRYTNILEDFKSGGYRVDLTIDLELQHIADKALNYSYNRIVKRAKEGEAEQINGAMVVLENHTGAVLSMVGGVDYSKSSFNRAVQSKRQPGSSAKPFIYQVALDAGYAPMSNIADISRTYSYKIDDEEKRWQPKNYEKNFEGLMSIREALVHSRNLATINLVQELGLDSVHRRLKFYGFKDIPYDLSLALGSFGISPLDMSRMYSIFSNNGVEVEPYFVTRMVNRYDQVVEFERESKYITSPSQAYLMTSVLKDVVSRGTGRSARVRGIELAGKTGTTNKNIDAWFCGYSPSIQTVVWFGNDDNTPMHKGETGGRAAAPAFSYFYKELLKIRPQVKRKFDIPNGVKSVFVKGKEEVFTEVSKPPKIEEQKLDDELVF